MKPKPTPVPEGMVFSKALRFFLYLTASLTGAVIMIVEILGAKMLAPFFGTSHFVWTAQIAVTLVALACGYYLGGRWVDRKQQLGNLYAAILTAAVYLAFTTLFCGRVAYACLKFSLPTGSLLGSALLFFVPLTLLAMVGPFFIRVLTSSVRSVGGNAGRLTAVSTFGSFVGTVLIGYVLIPFFSNSTILSGAASVLMALALFYFLAWGRSRRSTMTAVAGIVVASTVGFVGSHPEPWHTEGAYELARRNSNFGQLQVMQVERPAIRFFLDDYLAQNIYDPAERKSVAAFTYMLHGLARAYASRTDRVLCIGLGVGNVPMEFAREGSKVDVVEINPAVVPLATQFFNLNPAQIQIHIGDGRWFLNLTRIRYDAIILDAFLGDSSPSHLMTREAFSQMKRALNPEGVLVINTIGTLRPDRDFLTASIYKTLTNVFASVRVHVDQGNVFFAASSTSDLRFLRPPDLSQVHPMCSQAVRDGFDHLSQPEPEHGLILTDNYNPAEFYDAPNREEFRRKLAMSMKLPE